MTTINLTLVATIIVIQAWGKAVADEESPPNDIDPRHKQASQSTTV
jgi:hypothetical protein